MDASRSHAPRSVMGIVGLVLAIIAAATSFMPIVNNFSFFLALISAILSLVAVISCARGKKSGECRHCRVGYQHYFYRGRARHAKHVFRRH